MNDKEKTTLAGAVAAVGKAIAKSPAEPKPNPPTEGSKPSDGKLETPIKPDAPKGG